MEDYGSLTNQASLGWVLVQKGRLKILGFAGMEEVRCDRHGPVCMWQTLSDLELDRASAEIFGLAEGRGVWWRG